MCNLHVARRPSRHLTGLYVFGSLFNHSCVPNVALLKRDQDLDDSSVGTVRAVTGDMWR